MLLGVSLTLGYAPFSLWPVVPIAVAGYFYILSNTDHINSFKLGWLFGFGWFGTGVSWVHVSIADHGGLPLIGSLGLMALLCGYLALYPALASWLLKRYFTVALWPLAVPLIWLFCEWLRSWLFTGFPWLSLGYTQLEGPLAGWMPVIGETGVSALVVLLAAAMALWIPNKRLLPTAILAVVMLTAGWTINQVQWVSPQKPVNIAMVQGNIKQELRWVPEQDWPTMEKYLNLTEAHWHNDIVIWPEGAIPKLEATAQDYLKALDLRAAESETGLITGITNYNFETRQAFNNLLGIGIADPATPQPAYYYNHSNRFAKHQLLPIGEFIPLEKWIRGLAPIFDLPMSSFTRGDYRQQNLLSNGYRLSPAICFEIAFPHQIRANLYSDTDFIITVSNDAWFGDSHGPAQHLEIAQVRAKEFGKPVLRATNNGITAFVDHRGQIQSRAPQFEAAVLEDRVYTTSGTTPYRQLGDLPIWFVSLVLMGMAARQKQRPAK